MRSFVGFSLIELLVTVAIVAVLAAVAVPVYSAYQVRAKIINAIQILASVTESLEKTYSTTGYFPTSINFVGTTLTIQYSGGPDGSIWSGQQNLSNPSLLNILSVGYFISPDQKGAGFWISFNQLNIPGFQQYQKNSSDVYDYLAYAVRDVNGTLVTACGLTSSTDLAAVPLSYLPDGCQCKNISGTNGFLVSGPSAC